MRLRQALNLEEIKEPDIREAVSSLIETQEQVGQMSNNLSGQVQSVQQELEGILNRLKSADKNLNDLLTKMATQLSVLSDAVIQYQNNYVQGVDIDQKFTSSFAYILKNVVSNTRQLLDTLSQNTAAVGLSSPSGQQPVMENNVTTGPQLAPQSMLTSSRMASTTGFSTLKVLESLKSQRRVQSNTIKLFNEGIRTAGLLDSVTKTVEQLEPILDSSNTSMEKNDALLDELQEILKALDMVDNTTEQQEDDIFAPEEAEEDELKEVPEENEEAPVEGDETDSEEDVAEDDELTIDDEEAETEGEGEGEETEEEEETT